ncbi:MAG: PA14 domain-containing protein [Anaerolineae bacterium]
MSWRDSSPERSPSFLRIALIVGGVALAVAIVLAVFILRRQPTQPTIILSPPAGPPGALVTVSGQAWGAEQNVAVFLSSPLATQGEEVAVARSDAGGGFAVQFGYPTSGLWPSLTSVDVVARALDGQQEARAPFNVLPPTPAGPVGLPSGTPAETVTPAPTRIVDTTTPMAPPLPPGGGSGTGGGTGGGSGAGGGGAATAAPIVTATPFPAGPTTERVVGQVQTISVDMRIVGLVSSGVVRPVALAPDAVILDANGAAIALQDVPMGSLADALGVAEGPFLRASRFTVLAVPTQPPTAVPSATRPPATSTPVVIVVTATPPPVQPTSPVITAWRGEYWANRDLVGDPAFVENNYVIDFNWGTGAPVGPNGQVLPADSFSARWTQSFSLNDATYRFHARSDDGVRVWVDGVLVIDRWVTGGTGGQFTTGDIRLGAGVHSVRVEYFESGGQANISVWFEPLTIRRWRAEYYANRDLAGVPALVQDVSSIDFDWGYGAPAPGLPNNNFSARFMRAATFQDGTYRFTTTADDGVRLWIDDRLLIDEWHDASGTVYTFDLGMTAGSHDIKLEYYQNTGRALLQLGWTLLSTPTSTPGPTFTRVPTAAPLPPTATAIPLAPSLTPTTPPTWTLTPSPSPTRGEASPTPTATSVPATPTPTATATPTPTPTPTATAEAMATAPASRVVPPWEATYFPLQTATLETREGRISNVATYGAPPICFAFDISGSGAARRVVGWPEAVTSAAGLPAPTQPAQYLSPPNCPSLPTDPNSRVRVYGVPQPDGSLAAIRVEQSGSGQEHIPLYTRLFYGDGELAQVAPIFAGENIWVKTTAQRGATLVPAAQAALAALPPDTEVLAYGEPKAGTPVTLANAQVYARVAGQPQYRLVYPQSGT